MRPAVVSKDIGYVSGETKLRRLHVTVKVNLLYIPRFPHFLDVNLMFLLIFLLMFLVTKS